MTNCKVVGTPLDVNLKLVKLTKEEYTLKSQSMTEVPYKQVVGSLMYAMIAISCVSQHMTRPGSMHWVAGKRILRYLKGTCDIKLCLGGDNAVLSGYCDADYVGDTIN